MDEFQHFITPSMERILSGSRKYNLGLVLAHQEFRQLQSRSQDVASSILSNCYTRICFRLGDTDAEKFAGGFSFFDVKAFQNLGVGEAIARVERSEYDFNLTVNPVPLVAKDVAGRRKNAILDSSRTYFARPKAEVESELRVDMETAFPAETKQPIVTKPEKAPQQPNAEQTDDHNSVPIQTNPEHRYLQNIVKRIGESKGFVATIEKEVFGGVGKVGVALENELHKIACEIAITNTTQYETQNIQKCLSAGFNRVVVISSDVRHLENIRKRAELVLSSVHFSKVHFLEPENLHLFLESLQIREAAQASEPQKVKGYVIKTLIKEASASETETKKNVILDVLGRVIRRKKRMEDE